MSQSLRRPPLLRGGDRVRLVAPSGPVDPGRFEAGVARIRALGFEPVFEAAEVLSRDGYLAGSDARRAAELEAALADPDAAAIWAARGGYGATRLLPGLSVDAVRRADKWLVGFSDITALHALWRRAGLASVHAANATTLGDWDDEALGALGALLRDGSAPVLGGEGGNGRDPVVGPLAGGNLAVLAAMIGTPYFPDLEGTVLLLEDINEAPYQLDRLITQVEQAGALRGVLGVALGQLVRCDDAPEGRDPCRGLDVLRRHLERLGLPVVWGLPVGHELRSVAVPLGLPARLDARAATLGFGS